MKLLQINSNDTIEFLSQAPITAQEAEVFNYLTGTQKERYLELLEKRQSMQTNVEVLIMRGSKP